MKTEVRILLAAALVAILAGWIGLRRGNTALAGQVGPGRHEPKASVPPEQEVAR
jgi:hypothetical protein